MSAILRRCVEVRIVGHEPLLAQILLEHRVPAIADEKAAVIAHLRAAVVEQPCRLGKGAQHIQLGQGRGCLLDLRQPLQHGLPHALEQFVFQLRAALLRAQDLALHLLQGRRDEPLAVGDGLLASVVRGHLVQVGLGDLDVIAEHGIEPHLEGLDAGARDLILLQLGDPILAAAHGDAQLVQRGIEAVADQPAFLHGERRLVHNSAPDQFHQVRQLGHLPGQFLQQGQGAFSPLGASSVTAA